MSRTVKFVSKYYVYLHVHPETKVVVYVGKGTAGRAWACGHSSGAKNGRGNRTKEHQGWIFDLLKKGYTPDDFVEIIAKNLTNREAVQFENEATEYYKSLSPLFNMMCYGHPTLAALSPEQMREAQELRSQGLSYSLIAESIKGSTQTVWRFLTNKTKCYAVGGFNA